MDNLKDNCLFKRDTIAYRPEPNPQFEKEKQLKIREGQILETMMNTSGGKWLEKYFDLHIHIDKILAAGNPEKELNKIEALNELKQSITRAIDYKNELEGEKDE